MSLGFIWQIAEAQEKVKTFGKTSTAGVESESLSFHINYVYRQGGTGELRQIKDGEVLRSGDHYKIIFTPDKDSYVYIFQVDGARQVFQLFPMESFKGVPVDGLNPVKRGKTYILPGPDKAFMLDRKVGRERIYFIASNERNPEVERLYDDLKNKDTKTKNIIRGEEEPDKLQKYFRKRGIRVVAPSERSMEVPWQESGDVFSVMSQRLEKLDENGVHFVEFIHR